MGSRKRLVALLSGAVALATIAGAPYALAESATAKASDSDFVLKASAGNAAEVSAGQLAEKKAKSDAVKDFGRMMVRDHTQANEELRTLAGKVGGTIATEPDAEHRAVAERLSKLDGSAFDRDYMNVQVADHDKTIALFEAQAKDGKNAELKAWAQKKLPTLREHGQAARKLAAAAQ